MQLQHDKAWDLNLEAPIGPQLHRILRERIVRNDLVSGSKISETEIARFYSISRQPVREAFIKLSEEGLISIRPQRSTVIKRIDSEAVLHARFIREAIEADIVKLLATKSDPALVRELRAQLAEQERVAGSDPVKFTRLDERFHRTLAEASGNASAWKFIEGLKSQMDRVRFLSLSFFPMPKLIAQHKEIVDCIEVGNISQAESAIRLHLKEILKDLPEIQAVNPEFFSQAPE
ncbi:GntR family transcriptional regulator [Cohaesibacter gelatinilyticus]|uniref:DNA-binding transcriptional regulator, GntR family n=1 Tax=Cohaesibacter gelatinilyticus TaxID=372072 RepID=A0A285NC64_9HYPH|nr:GntR family transcriptional regulator [Cohaesibacter gelatinilyticus]SNZ05261.1 DNA-binding transcriptional regulator, GntR family [Cohaesibacter gelatinilyticus]